MQQHAGLSAAMDCLMLRLSRGGQGQRDPCAYKLLFQDTRICIGIVMPPACQVKEKGDGFWPEGEGRALMPH